MTLTLLVFVYFQLYDFNVFLIGQHWFGVSCDIFFNDLHAVYCDYCVGHYIECVPKILSCKYDWSHIPFGFGYFNFRLFQSLSISTAFCYAWRYILRLELQQREFNFSSAFEGSFESNDFKFGVTMIVIDLILYTIVGYLYERFTNDEFKFHQVPTKDMDIGIGGALHNCTKTYEGSERPAIDNVSILFRRDYITCLLGRNGAGKSTIIKLLTGQIAPTSGHVFWPLNWDRITGNEFDDRIGLCPQNNILIPNLTAKEHLELYVRIKSGNKNTSSNRSEVERVMRSLQFGKHENFYSQNLSGGFKRRLNVAIAFIGECC